jgi:hypothetical protein
VIAGVLRAVRRPTKRVEAGCGGREAERERGAARGHLEQLGLRLAVLLLVSEVHKGWMAPGPAG